MAKVSFGSVITGYRDNAGHVKTTVSKTVFIPSEALIIDSISKYVVAR